MDPQGSSQSSVWSQSSVRRKRPKTGSEILHLLSKSAKTRATSSVTTTTTTTTTTATTDTGRHASSIQLVRDTQEETAQQRKRPRIRLEFDSPEQQRVRALEKLDEFKKRYSSLRCSDNAARKPNFNFAFRHRRDYRHKDLADFDDKLSEITYSTDTDFSLFAPSLRESQQDEDVASFVSESEISVDLRGWEPPLDTIMESEGLNVETQPLSSLESEQQKEPKGKEPIRQIRSAEPSAVEGRETQQETERAESPALDRHKQKTTVNEKRSEELAIVTTASEKAVEPISIAGNDKQITSPAKQDIGETTATQLDTQPPVNFDDAFYDIPDNDFGEYETDQPGPSAVEKPPSIPPLSPGPVLSNGQPSIDDNASAVALLEEGEEDRLIAQMERSSLTRRVPPGDTFISNKIRERQEAIRQGRPIDRGVRHCPINVTKRLFSTFTSMKLEADVQKKIEEASNLFLEQLADDLSTYADHARRGMITPDDVTLLMKRQGLLTEQTSLEALAHERLPRELWDSICVSALAHNALYPEDFDEEEEY